MKKNLFFIIFLLISCSPNAYLDEKTSCPNVLFSSEHRDYIAGNDEKISIDNLSYKATINNYNFNTGCVITNNVFRTKLSLLFVIQPEKLKVNEVNLPYYVAIIDNSGELIDMQYFQVKGEFDVDTETKEFIETELIDKVIVQVKLDKLNLDSENTILLGFMLDNKKLQILN